MIDLSGRVALVTGAGRGIGRGIVLALAQAGADVALADVDLASAERTAKEVEAGGRTALVVRLREVLGEHALAEGGLVPGDLLPLAPRFGTPAASHDVQKLHGLDLAWRASRRVSCWRRAAARRRA